MLDYLIDRLREPSSWRGIIADLEDAAAAQIAALPDDTRLEADARAIIEAVAWP